MMGSLHRNVTIASYLTAYKPQIKERERMILQNFCYRQPFSYTGEKDCLNVIATDNIKQVSSAKKLCFNYCGSQNPFF